MHASFASPVATDCSFNALTVLVSVSYNPIPIYIYIYIWLHTLIYIAFTLTGASFVDLLVTTHASHWHCYFSVRSESWFVLIYVFHTKPMIDTVLFVHQELNVFLSLSENLYVNSVCNQISSLYTNLITRWSVQYLFNCVFFFKHTSNCHFARFLIDLLL